MKTLQLLGDDVCLARSVAARLGWRCRLLNHLEEVENGPVFACFLDPKRQRDSSLELHQKGAELVSLVDPSATVDESVVVGPGCLVSPRAVINADSLLGSGCVVGMASSLDHDNVLGDWVRIGSLTNLAGTVRVGEGGWVGAGVSVVPGRSIGAGARLENGSVVVRDVPDGAHWGGVPARPR